MPRGRPDRAGARRRGHRATSADFSLARAGRCATSGRWSTGSPAHGYVAEVRRVGDITAAELDADRQGRRPLARQPTPSAASRWRSAGSATPGDERLRARHRDRGRRAVARRAALRPVGPRRPVARPDAAGPGRRARAERIPDRGGHQGRPGARRQADLAELRGVPGRAGARRADRRRPGAAGLARAAACSCPRWFQIESLYKFNAKFQPVWEPRFFVFPSTGTRPGSRWPRWRPRRSWSGRGSSCAGSRAKLGLRQDPARKLRRRDRAPRARTAAW